MWWQKQYASMTDIKCWVKGDNTLRKTLLILFVRPQHQSTHSKLKWIPIFLQVHTELSSLDVAMSYLNINWGFYFGKYAAWNKSTFLCGRRNFSYWLPVQVLHLLQAGNMTSGVICVFAGEIGLLFHRSHFLLRELLPHEPVDISIFRFLLNAKTPQISRQRFILDDTMTTTFSYI